jgi:hypothetical protein
MTDRDYPVGRSGAEKAGDTDAAFVARIAGPLRAPESLDATFEHRLMSAVHADALHRVIGARGASHDDRGWWRRPRTVSMSPLAGLALAASLVGLLALGSAAIGSVLAEWRLTAPAAIASRHDTVHVVRFVFVDPTARSVSLVGDFNGWSKSATQLEPAGDRGGWIVSIPLTSGRHEYAFIVDGRRWTVDPFAPERHDDFGTASSVVTVGQGRESTKS